MAMVLKLQVFALVICLSWPGAVLGAAPKPEIAGGIMEHDRQTMPETVQGALVECEECRVLHPERYKNTGESCPLCKGRGERLQPARLMDENLAAEESRAELLRLETLLFEQLHRTPLEPGDADTLRQGYLRLLRHTLVHGGFERDWLVSRILDLEKTAVRQSGSEQLPVNNAQE